MAEHRAGFVAVAGRTNVGKSTLVNRLVGHKVAIVTPRPQTTRRRILGIRTDTDSQILLIDTPGLHEAKKQLNQRMVQTARRAIAEGEVILAVVEAGDHLNPGDRAVLVDIRALARPTIVAINKVDRVPRAQLLPLIEEINRGFPGAEIIPVSALTGTISAPGKPRLISSISGSSCARGTRSTLLIATTVGRPSARISTSIARSPGLR